MQDTPKRGITTALIAINNVSIPKASTIIPAIGYKIIVDVDTIKDTMDKKVDLMLSST